VPLLFRQLQKVGVPAGPDVKMWIATRPSPINISPEVNKVPVAKEQPFPRELIIVVSPAAQSTLDSDAITRQNLSPACASTQPRVATWFEAVGGAAMMFPATSNLAPGAVVPMPTLPAGVIIL